MEVTIRKHENANFILQTILKYYSTNKDAQEY